MQALVHTLRHPSLLSWGWPGGLPVPRPRLGVSSRTSVALQEQPRLGPPALAVVLWVECGLLAHFPAGEKSRTPRLQPRDHAGPASRPLVSPLPGPCSSGQTLGSHSGRWGRKCEHKLKQVQGPHWDSLWSEFSCAAGRSVALKHTGFSRGRGQDSKLAHMQGGVN